MIPSWIFDHVPKLRDNFIVQDLTRNARRQTRAARIPRVSIGLGHCELPALRVLKGSTMRATCRSRYQGAVPAMGSMSGRFGRWVGFQVSTVAARGNPTSTVHALIDPS